MALSTGRTLLWVARVLAVFLRFQPLVTVMLIGCQAIIEITHVLVFFIPIKVIILAGSEQFPNYLQGVLGPEHRLPLIMALAAGTVILFFMTFLLDALATSLAKAGGLRALNRANRLALASREQVEAPRYFSRFCRVAANLTFVLVALALLIALQPNLVFVLISLIALEYGLTHLIFFHGNPLLPHTLAFWVRHHLSDYLGLLSAINLLAGFIALILPFLIGGTNGNIMITLLSFLIMRQCLTGLKKFSSETVSLASRQYLIDPLIFRKHQAELAPEIPHKQAFRNLFLQSGRQEVVARTLRWQPGPERALQVQWTNAIIPGICLFRIIASDQRQAISHAYQQQIFMPDKQSLLEHEDFLFRYIDREATLAPPVIARSKENIFHFQICDAGLGKHFTREVWAQNLPDIQARLWDVSPPRALVKAFLSSKRILPGRLTEELIARVFIAVDDSAEANSLQLLINSLHKIRERLESLPLIIHNPHFSIRATMARGDSLPYIMHWVGWSIEPIGYGIPSHWKDSDLTAFTAHVSRCRQNTGKSIPMVDIRLVIECQRIEDAIRREAYKEALVQARKIAKYL